MIDRDTEVRLRTAFDIAMELRDRRDFDGSLKILLSIEAYLGEVESQDKWQSRFLTHVSIQMGNVCNKLSRTSDAITHFRRAVELSPRHELSSLGLFHALISADSCLQAAQEMVRYLLLRDCRDYRDILAGGFGAHQAPDVADLADRARTLLRNYEPN